MCAYIGDGLGVRDQTHYVHVHIHTTHYQDTSRTWSTVYATIILIISVPEHVRDVRDMSVTIFVAHTVEVHVHVVCLHHVVYMLRTCMYM